MSQNTSVHNLRKGMRVSLTFTGEITASDYGSVSFRHPDGLSMPITWSDRLSPQVEILDPGYEDGDVGVWTGGITGTKVNVVFKRFNANGSEGWYNVANGEFVSMPDSHGVQLILRADSTLVEGIGL